MARTSLTAAVSTFVTGAQPKPSAKARRRLPLMENSLRGSARVDTVGTREASANGTLNTNAISRQWQEEAWQRYDEVGEVRYAAGFIGACLSRCRLTVGYPDSNGNIGPAFDENGDPIKDENGNVLPGLERAAEALDLIRMLKSDVAGQSQLLRAMGINLAVAGEFHLVGSAETDAFDNTQPVSEINEWEVLSTDEFKPSGENYVRRPLPGATTTDIPGDSVHVVRIWRSHPRFSELPDSSMRAVLPILEELVLLTREVLGETVSRLPNNKVFAVPDEIDFTDDDAEDGDSEAGDPFTADLIRTFGTAIRDKGSAAATVPFIMRAPGDLIGKIQVFDLSRSNPSDSAAKRTEAVQRFAQGIDLPVEIVVGHSGTSFANAVVIDDSTYKVHIEPILEIICDALTSGYLRPSMEESGQEETPLVVFYDSTELVSRPNRAQDAKDAHDRFALSDASLRTSLGFSESDRPTGEEILQRIKWKQLLGVRQTVDATTGQLNSETNQGADLTPPGTSAEPGGQVTQGASAIGASDDGANLTAALTAIAEVTVDRAVRRAGARLRSKSAKVANLRELLSQVPDAEVPATLGLERLKQVIGDEDLLRGEFDVMHAWAMRKVGNEAYADSLRDACITITSERFFAPREPFPIDRLPKPYA